MTDLADAHKKPLVQLLFSIADDKLVLGHRNADWTGLGPILEEDIAFSALAQDDIAHAGAIYGLIADITGGDADHLAYGRTANTYRCCDLVELNDEFDWAVAVVRHGTHRKLREQQPSPAAGPGGLEKPSVADGSHSGTVAANHGLHH